MKATEATRATRKYLMGLWYTWTIACTALALPLILSPMMSKIWLPLVVIGEIFGLAIYMRSNKMRQFPRCMRTLYMVMSVLIVSSVLMILFNLLHVNWLFGNTRFDLSYDHTFYMPYLTILIMAPLLMLVSLWNIITGRRSTFCMECRKINMFAADDGFIGHMLRKESSYQLRTLFYIGTFLTVIDWCYYFLFFINVNVNSPDLFFFNIMPVAILVLSVIYMGQRAYNTWGQYLSSSPDAVRNTPVTELRYLVISEGRVLLEDEEKAIMEGHLVDTPFIIELHNSSKPTMDEAERRFADRYGIHDFQFRYLFCNTSCVGSGIAMHYAVFLKDESQVDAAKFDGKWYNAIHLEEMLGSGVLSPGFINEFNRIYTVTMAWKTYDKSGRRLYPIKNYRPTFRLDDFKDWDVDYDDTDWLNVALHNEDRRFYRMRKLWRHYVRNFG